MFAAMLKTEFKSRAMEGNTVKIYTDNPGASGIRGGSNL
jgi:hypothetical protein